MTPALYSAPCRCWNCLLYTSLAPNVLKMRVWERGSGETMACGTGACAAAVAAVENGYCDKDTDITVKLLGGELIIRYTEQTVYLTGNAALIYKGTVQP